MVRECRLRIYVFSLFLPFPSLPAENVLMALLAVAANQIPYVENPEALYAQYTRIFAFLAAVEGRQALIGVLESFAKRIPELEVVVRDC